MPCLRHCVGRVAKVSTSFNPPIQRGCKAMDPKSRMVRGVYPFSVVLAVVLAGARCPAADWPQFMRNPAHTGDAADEELRLPLGLVAQVRLDDAVMTSPAVVGGRAYVVDQMGTAYCIDARAGRIVWKASPDAAGAMGANTSSPCVAQGRVCFGTTAGNFHILDARDGKVVKTLEHRHSDPQRPDLCQRLRSTSRRSMPSFAAWTSTATSAGNGTTTPASRSRRKRPRPWSACERRPPWTACTARRTTAAARWPFRARGSSPASAGTSSAWRTRPRRRNSSGATGRRPAGTGRRRCRRRSPAIGSTPRAWGPTA